MRLVTRLHMVAAGRTAVSRSWRPDSLDCAAEADALSLAL